MREQEPRALVEQLAIDYHKTVEGEYGCNGLTWPGVQRLIQRIERALGGTPLNALPTRENGWQPIATAPLDGTVILRPHRIWGAMDVRYFTTDEKMVRRIGALEVGIDWRWLNGDYTTAWTEDAFLPFWMPLPKSPAISAEILNV